MSFAETIRYGNLPEDKAFPFNELNDFSRLNVRNFYQPSGSPTTGKIPTGSKSDSPIIVKNLTPRSLLMDDCSTKSAQVGNKAKCSPEKNDISVTDSVPDSSSTAPLLLADPTAKEPNREAIEQLE